jgi:hypothetical protein
VVDSVEKFFEVKINHDAEALRYIALCLSHGLMGRASRSESETVLGKRRVPSVLKDLQHGLLDQAVDDARHAEFSDPAIGLGYFNPFDRQRLIYPDSCGRRKSDCEIEVYGFVLGT